MYLTNELRALNTDKSFGRYRSALLFNHGIVKYANYNVKVSLIKTLITDLLEPYYLRCERKCSH